MPHYEPINFTYYDPNNSLFKSDRRAREKYTLYECCNKENCDAYKRKKCVMLNGLFGHKCPYGKRSSEVGYTKPAKRCGDLIYQAKERYGDVAYALEPLSFLCRIGDYVYLNLPHLNNYVNPIRSNDFFIGDDIIKAENFTVEFVIELINFHPHAMMGGEIMSYQEKEVPAFCNQLKKYFPEMYEDVKEIYFEIELYIQSIDYREKYAKVKTLLPGDVKVGIYTMKWDGQYLRTNAHKMAIFNLDGEDMIIVPKDDTYVKVVDNDTVTDDTEFKDE